MPYPKFKFSCGCELERHETIVKTERMYCPKHNGTIVDKIILCETCGEPAFVNPRGKQTVCPECKLKKKQAYQREYAAKRYASEKENPPEPGLIKTDLLPNPVITDPDRSPCEQGCQLAGMDKKNTTCVFKCPYRLAYVARIDGFEAIEFKEAIHEEI